MSEPSNPNPENTSPVLKRRTLITGASGAATSGPKLVSEAELVEAAPRARFLTPVMQKQLEEEQALQAQQAEQDALRIAAEQEAARIEAEKEAARLAEEQEAARILAEQQAAQEAVRIAAEQEAERVAAEKEAARLAEEKEAARIAAEQAAQQQTITTNTEASETLDPKIQTALDQIKLAQEALAAAQKQALEMAALVSSSPSGTSSSPASNEQPEKTIFNTGANTQTSSAQSSEQPKKTLFKVGGVSAVQEEAPKTADFLKEKIAASLNQATSGSTASLEPSPILSPSETVPVVPKDPIVLTQPKVMPEAIWKKKSFKIGAIIGACVLILSAVLLVMAFNAKAEQKRQNEYLTKLCEIGSQLGRRAAELGGTTGSDLKYDRDKYKIDIAPNEKDAKILLDRVGSKEQQGGWESAAHYLGVMGQVDPKIAKMTVDALAKNPKLYIDGQYMMIVSILACDKDPNIQKLLFPLMKQLEAAKQYKKAGIVLKQMRYGMTPDDVASIMKYLTDPKANGEIANAARECLRSITHKADDSGKSAVSKSIITELRNAPNEKDLPTAQRVGLLSALALTGTPEAQAYFQEYIKGKQPAQIRMALRSMGEWGNDNIVPFLMELRKDPSMTAEQAVKNDLDRILLQRLSKDGERTEEQGTALFKPLIDEAEELAKNAKTPQDEEAVRTLKTLIVSAVGRLKERPYVTQIIELYKNDPDENVSSIAKKMEARMKEMEQKRKASKVSAADKATEWEKRFAQ